MTSFITKTIRVQATENKLLYNLNIVVDDIYSTIKEENIVSMTITPVIENRLIVQYIIVFVYKIIT